MSTGKNVNNWRRGPVECLGGEQVTRGTSWEPGGEKSSGQSLCLYEAAKEVGTCLSAGRRTHRQR